MHKWKIFYSSATGNTKKIAGAIGEIVGAEPLPIDRENGADDADIVAVGYWLWRGGPDPKTAEFLPRIKNANVALFETHAAENRTEHAVTAFARAAYLLGENCRILATFECQGQVSEAIAARHAKLPPDDPHAKATGWKTSAGHPDGDDIKAAKEFAAAADHKLSLLEEFAKRNAG